MKKLLIITSISFLFNGLFALSSEQISVINKVADKVNLTNTEKIIFFSLFNKSFQNENLIIKVNSSLSNEIKDLRDNYSLLLSKYNVVYNKTKKLEDDLKDLKLILDSKIKEIYNEINLTRKEIKLFSYLNISNKKENDNFERELSLILLKYLLDDKNKNDNDNKKENSNEEIIKLIDERLNKINNEISDKIESKLENLNYLEDKINYLSQKVEEKNNNWFFILIIALLGGLFIFVYWIYLKLQEISKKPIKKIDLSKIEDNFEEKEEKDDKKIKKW